MKRFSIRKVGVRKPSIHHKVGGAKLPKNLYVGGQKLHAYKPPRPKKPR